MLTHATPKMRLLLIKSDGQHLGQFKHSGKYYLAGGRWHTLHHDKPVPKGAAVAAHPHAAGAPKPARSMLTESEWAHLKLPAENSNASTFNKQIDQLKAAAAVGDVTGILGSGYGINTYSKKLAVIANHVLDLLGSDHKVTPGQKPGAHPAVQTAPQIEAGQPAPVEPVEAAPAAADAGPKNGDTKQGADGQQLVFKDGRWHKYVDADEHGEVPPALVPVADQNPEDAAPEPAAEPAALAMPAFIEGKTVTGVVDYYQNQAKKIMGLAAAGDVASLEGMKSNGLQPNHKGKVSNTWAGKTPNSKLLLALHAKALEQAKGGAPDESAKDEAIQSAVDHLKEDAKQGDLPAAEKKEDAELVQKLEAAQSAPADEFKVTASGYLEGKGGYIQQYANLKQANMKADQMKSAGYDVHVTASHPFKIVVNSKPVAAAPSLAGVPAWNHLKQFFQQGDFGWMQTSSTESLEAGVDAWLAANPAGAEDMISSLVDLGSNKLASKLKAERLNGAPKANEPRLVLPKKARDAAPAAPDQTAVKQPEPASLTVSADQAMPGGKLDQIPWDGLKLPDSNKNAKSHNKQVEKIKAMAYAGDLAGLEAFKAGKNTYGKAQNKLAQTALAALKEGAPAALATKQLAGYPAYDHIAQQLKAGGFADTAAKEWEAANPGAWDELNEALTAHGYEHLATFGPVVAKPDAGPHEGDTKQGADGTLVFQNGRWHKQEKPLDPKAKQAVDSLSLDELKAIVGAQGLPPATVAYIKEKIAAAADQVPAPAAAPAPESSGPPAPPEFSAVGGNPQWANHYATVAAALHAKVQSEGANAFKGVVTSHSDGRFTIALAGFKLKKVGPDDKAEYRKQMHAYVAALKAAVGKPKKAAAKPKAAAAAPAPQPAAAAPEVESMDAWEQTGKQAGSNPGGRFKDQNGEEWYCKFPADEDVAKSELLAAKLYAALGISGQDAKLITKDGKVGIASKWTSVSKAQSPAALSKVQGVAEGFGADAWLGNWDVVGLGYDNLQIGADGKAHRVDAGGSLMYRAQGGKKAFGASVIEIDSLRDAKINPQAAAVFGGLTDSEITASVAKVLTISDAQIMALVYQHGPGDMAAKKSLAETLIARKADLAAKFPKAVPKASAQTPSAPVYRVPTAPDFKNWNGPGKGLSSKAAFNNQNQEITQAIYDAGVKGDVAAVKAMTYQPINESGEPVGAEKSVLDHPSQHIPIYFKDVLHAMTTPYVSPKIALAEAVKNLSGSFAAMRSMWPGFKALKDAAKKIGRYAVLGKATAGHPLEGWKPNLVSRKQGSLNENALFKASQAAFKALSGVERLAIKDYTGSSYDSMNSALIQGLNHDMAFNAVSGMEKASVMLPAGAVLSRRFSFDKAADGSQSSSNHEKAMAELLQAGEGAILQEFGIISTSTRSDFWSGRVHLKITVGEGVKGLYVASDPTGSGAAPISKNPGESEIMLPFGTKFMVTKIHPKGHKFQDETGAWGQKHGDEIVIEVTALPNV